MTYYKDYPSISINEINQSYYTPLSQKGIINVGVVGFASWGEINKPIFILPGEREKRIGKITKEYPLPYIAVDNILETGKANVLFWRLPTTNMTKANKDVILISGVDPNPDFKLTFYAKYPGSYGNNISVKIVQRKENVGTTYYYYYDIYVLLNDNVVESYRNVEFFDNTKINYYLILFEKSEYITVEESGKENYTIDDLNFSSVFSNTDFIIINLENGNDGIPTSETEIKNIFLNTNNGILGFKNKTLGSVRLMVNTYHKFDKEIINTYLQLANIRKDFLFITSTQKDISDLDAINNSTVDLTQSSYGAIYTNWEKIFNKELNQYVWIPSVFNIVKTFLTMPYLWSAPAGYEYGYYQGEGNFDYFLNEEEAIPKLQSGKNVVNPIIKDKNGFFIMGQKTLLRENSALNRINTRLALLDLEETLLDIMKKYLFSTVNDAETRTKFVKETTNIVNKYINTKAFSSIDIICDETNNTPQIINDNAFVVDIHVTPVKTNEKIAINIYLHEYGWTIEEIK